MITSVRNVWSRAGFLGAKNFQNLVLVNGLKDIAVSSRSNNRRS